MFIICCAPSRGFNYNCLQLKQNTKTRRTDVCVCVCVAQAQSAQMMDSKPSPVL